MTSRTELLPSLLAESHSTHHHTAPRIPEQLRPLPLTGPVYALPPPRRYQVELEPALRGRTAVRAYAAAPVMLDELAAFLAAAHEFDVATWPAESASGAGLELFCAALRVADLPTGLYRYRPDRAVLERVAELPLGAGAENLVLQKEFAAAPVLCTVTGNLAAAQARHGGYGHRQLLVRAGAAAHAAWLAALRLDLVGTVFAGLLPQVLRDRAGADGYRRAPLFAFAAGRRPYAPEGGPS